VEQVVGDLVGGDNVSVTATIKIDTMNISTSIIAII